MKLFVQIPCLNEEETIEKTLKSIPTKIEGIDDINILIIDDGCSDRTIDIAKKCGVKHFVRHHSNFGLAKAFMNGLDYCLNNDADLIINTDADNQYDARGIENLTKPILSEDADIVIGERPIESITEFSRTKKILQRLGSLVVRQLSGTEVRDAASGFRACSADAAARLWVYGKYSYTMETLVQAGSEGLMVQSVAINVNPKTRESRLVKSIPRYVFRSGMTIVRTFILYNPFRFFCTLSAPFLLAGFTLFLRWLLLYFLSENYSSRTPSLVLALLLSLLGFFGISVALMADQMSANRKQLNEIRYQLASQEVRDSPKD